MGWLSKVLGIDARHAREDAETLAKKAADEARAKADAQAAATAEQNKQYNQSMLDIQRQSLEVSKSAAQSEEKRINDARQAAMAADEAEALRTGNANILAANNRVDLRADTVANVVAGGSAEAVATEAAKKKRQLATANPISGLLGINI